MQFQVVERNEPFRGQTGPAAAFLQKDNWNDWGEFQTQFQLFVRDASGVFHAAGDLKIGHFGLVAGGQIVKNVRSPALKSPFTKLPSGYFSLGQRETYYETLNQLPEHLKGEVLAALRDCASDLALFDRAWAEPSMVRSLLRYVDAANVRNRLHRLAIGNAVLTRFEFEFDLPEPRGGLLPPPTLSFLVIPESNPPTNVHVLVGRNGVGKTRSMQSIASTLLSEPGNDTNLGELRRLGVNEDEWSFSGLVSVSFSAFDDFDLPDARKLRIKATAVNLRQRDVESGEVVVKTPAALAQDFVRSFIACKSGLRRSRWQQAVRTLENDPLFADENVVELLDDEEPGWEVRAADSYSGLSSGHKIVLLTVTRLVELVDERTLVLIDEPEGHLHPPLLSAFMRTLADLLVARNGVGIVATHSPVVLQEVPSSCVWILRRAGRDSTADRPELETFAENVGVLTREVFGLEVTTSGFHERLREAVSLHGNFEAVVSAFHEQLGAEGRAIVRAMVASQPRTSQS